MVPGLVPSPLLLVLPAPGRGDAADQEKDEQCPEDGREFHGYSSRKSGILFLTVRRIILQTPCRLRFGCLPESP